MTMAVSGVSATTNYYTQAASAGAVSIAVAVAAIKANSRTKVTISDTSANIAKNLDALGKLANNINQITQSDPSVVMDVTASQQSKLGTLFGKFSTNYQLNVSGVTASAAAGLSANSHVATLTVSDTSSNITTQLNALQGKDKITSIIPTTRSTAINVTAAQMTSHADVLGKINGAYALSVSQATAAQAAGYASDARVKSVSILDTAAGVSAKLDDLRALGLRLKEIRSSDAAVFQVTADQVQTDALVIGKIYRGFQLSVLNASMGQAQALSKDTKVISIDVADTAANLSSNLELLGKLGSHLHSVHVTDTANPLSMTSAQFGVYADVLAKIQAGDAYTVSVKEASVEEAQTLLGNAKVSAISVSDTSKSIAGSLHALNQNTKVASIYQTGKTSALAVTVGQLTTDATALSKLQGNYNLDVSGVTAATALQLATSNSRITNLSVSDTAAQITAKLDDLAALGKRLGSVTQSDSSTALRLSVGQWSSQIGVLAKITGGYSVALTGVSAAKAQSLASDSRVKSVAVSDTAQAISAQLDSLHTLGAQLESISRTDADAVKLTATQYDNYGTTIDKLSAGYSLAVRDVAASRIGAVAANTKVSSVAVSDSSANIAANLDAIQDVIAAATANSSGLQVSVRQSGNLGTMRLTASQLTRDADALGSIGGNYSLMVTGVLAANASTVAQNGKVVGMTVTDSGANLVSKLSALTTLGTRVASITQTNPSTALNLSASDWSTYMGVLSKITGGYRVALSDVRVSGAQALLSDGRVQSVAVKDSAAQISSNLDMLQGLGPLLTAVGQTDAGTAISVSMNQLSANASTLAKLDAGYKLSVRDATAAQAQALLDNSYSAVESVSVVDSSANIAAQLDALNANTKLATILQSGKATALTVTQAQMTADATALGKIQGSYSLAVSDAAAGDVATLAANSRVASMVVTDTGANILAKLADLKSAGPKISTLNLSNPSSTLAMTYTQWAGHQGTLGKIAQNYSVSVSGVSAANAGSVAANTRVASLAVSDSMARINSSLDSLQGLGPQLTAITPTDSGTLPALVLTAAQKVADSSALAKLNGGTYTMAVTNASVVDAQNMASDAKVLSIAVSDSSDNIAGLLDELVANGKVNSVTQTGTPETISLTATQLAASTALLAKFQNAYTLDVRGAAMGSAATLQANSRVASFSLSATTSEVASNLTALASMGKLGDIKLSADDGLITLSETQMDTYADTLAQLQGVYRLKVTGVSMTNLDTVASTTGVSAIELSATSQSISDRFDDLLALGDTLTSITDTSSSTPIALTHGQWLQSASVLGKVQGSYSLAVLDVAAENALSMKAQANVATVSVLDTASNISANFDSLLAMGASLDTIELLDDNPVTITSAQNSAAGASVMLAKIIGENDVVVEG
jgi:hypothetical protein